MNQYIYRFLGLILGGLTMSSSVNAAQTNAVSSIFSLDTRTLTGQTTSVVSSVFSLDTRTLTSQTTSAVSSVFRLDTRGDGDANSIPDYWEVTFFGNTGVVLPDDDTDRDGMSNFLEWALGLNPTEGNGATDVMQAYQDEEAGEEYLYFKYLRRTDAAAPDYTVEYSENLIDWNSGELYIEEVEVTAHNPAFEWVTIRTKVPAQEDKTQFLRLKVSN